MWDTNYFFTIVSLICRHQLACCDKMTIILKLQGLDVKASTQDIRTFFKCLHIPDGGVYIVGGSLGEAFIAFTTERDAQLAMRHTGNFLKGSKVSLHISSMEEMEHKLKSQLKKNKKSSPNKLTSKKPQPSPDESSPPLNALPHNHNPGNLHSTAWLLDPHAESQPQPLYPNMANLQTSPVQSLDSSTAFLLGVCTVLQGLQSSQRQNKEPLPGVDLPTAGGTVVSEPNTPELTLISRPGYVSLLGLPASATKEDICHFFKGLSVKEAIVNVKLGYGRGCLVKFASMQDACDALQFNQQSLGTICVEVRAATEKMWMSALQKCENADNRERVKPHDNSCKETANHRQKHTSALQLKRRVVNQLPSKGPKKSRPDCDSAILSPTMEYIVIVRNLCKEMTKTEIKQLFGCPNLAHKNVLHLLDKEGNRTDTAFLIFNCTEDYDYAMNLTGCHVGSAAIEVSSITKEKMRDMMAKTHPRNIINRQMDRKKSSQKRKLHKVVTSEAPPSTKPDVAAQTCLFVRNLPADVQKNHIKDFFCKYKLQEDNISLLHDSDGKGIGEAVVQFKSQKLAALAQRLHCQDFLGAQVLLTCINVKQMKDIVARNE